MGVLDYFKPVPAWTAGEVREFLDRRNPQEYNLVDVRTPREYEKEHLPGARLMPMGELENRLRELDPEKVTIAY
jgi:rhodanese-related sulfurtransferase